MGERSEWEDVSVEIDERGEEVGETKDVDFGKGGM